MHEHEGLLEAAWHEGCTESECGSRDKKQDEPAGHRMAGLSLDGEMTARNAFFCTAREYKTNLALRIRQA